MEVAPGHIQCSLTDVPEGTGSRAGENPPLSVVTGGWQLAWVLRAGSGQVAREGRRTVLRGWPKAPSLLAGQELWSGLS